VTMLPNPKKGPAEKPEKPPAAEPAKPTTKAKSAEAPKGDE